VTLSGLPPLWWVLALVMAQRLGELALASANTRRLLARGGREAGRGHYPLFVLLHASWLLAIALTVPPEREPNRGLLLVFLVLQIARVWVVATLGPFWTTRVITVPDAPLVRRGPFRLVRHPNYWIVGAEILVLPLAFGAVWVGLVWTVLNALLIRHRVSVEERALAPRAAAGRPSRFTRARP
jgi:methyltransferase